MIKCRITFGGTSGGGRQQRRTLATSCSIDSSENVEEIRYNWFNRTLAEFDQTPGANRKDINNFDLSARWSARNGVNGLVVLAELQDYHAFG